MTSGLMAKIQAAVIDGSIPQPFSVNDALAYVQKIGLPYPAAYVRAALRRATSPSHCRKTCVYFRETESGRYRSV